MAKLTGMTAIAKHMNRTEATILAMVRTQAFPAAKVGGIWESDTDEIEKWRKSRLQPPAPQEKQPSKKGKEPLETRV